MTPGAHHNSKNSGLGGGEARVNAEQGPTAWEWLWRGRALAEARRIQREFSPVGRQRLRLARAYYAVAERTRRPLEPFVEGVHLGLVCQLYGDAIRQGLLAVVEHANSETDVGGSGAQAPAQAAVTTLWSKAHVAGLVSRPDVPAGEGDGGELQQALRLLVAHEREDLALLPLGEQRLCARILQAGASAVLVQLGGGQSVATLQRQRVSRLSLSLVCILGASVFLAGGADVWRRDKDWARGAVWRASSSNGMGCVSPAQFCPGQKHFFFHTGKQSYPWLVVELGAERKISKVVIANRRDCCQERAVPLVVEVLAPDGRGWIQVAQRNKTFNGKWTAQFPSRSTSAVRVKVARTSILHLASVSVF